MRSSTDDWRLKLQLERQKLQKRIKQIQQDEQQETASDQTDTAHEWENADVRDGLLTVVVQELKQVDAALERIDLGTFGLCEVCSEPIAEKRLDALPFTTYCIQCADSQR